MAGRTRDALRALTIVRARARRRVVVPPPAASEAVDSLLLARKWAPPLMVLASCTPYRAQYMSNFCDGDIALGELLFLQCVSVCVSASV